MGRLLRNVYTLIICWAMAGCAGTATTGTSICVFVGDTMSNALTPLKYDPAKGLLVAVDVDIVTRDVLTDLKFSPIYNNLYAVSANNEKIEIFSIEARTCKLTSIQADNPADPFSIGFNKLGAFAFLSTTTGDLSTYLHDGAAGTFTGPIATNAGEGSVMVVHPSGSFAYQGAATGHLRPLKLNGSTGALTQGTKVATGLTSGTGISFMAINPTGELLYVTDGADLKHYSINANTGEITLVGTLSTTKISSLSFSPNGYTAFAVSNTAGELRTYMMTQSSGAMTLRQTYTDDLGDPLFGSTDETGAYYFVTANSSKSVNAYTVNGSKLTAASGGHFSNGGTPGVIAVKTFSY